MTVVKSKSHRHFTHNLQYVNKKLWNDYKRKYWRWDTFRKKYVKMISNYRDYSSLSEVYETYEGTITDRLLNVERRFL